MLKGLHTIAKAYEKPSRKITFFLKVLNLFEMKYFMPFYKFKNVIEKTLYIWNISGSSNSFCKLILLRGLNDERHWHKQINTENI